MLIEPLMQFDPEFSELLETFRRTSGFAPNSLLTMRRRPEVQKALLNLFAAVMAPHPGSRVTPELKTLLGFMVSHAAGCRYCQAHSAYGAKRGGESDERIAQIWNYQSSPLFSDAERAALDLARGAGFSPNAVTAEMRAEARRHWTDDELVEIVAMIAGMGFMNRWNDTIGTPLEEQPLAFAKASFGAAGWGDVPS